MTAEEIQKVAEIANAASFIRDFPKGFDTVVGEKGILLSGTFSFYSKKKKKVLLLQSEAKILLCFVNRSFLQLIAPPKY